MSEAQRHECEAILKRKADIPSEVILHKGKYEPKALHDSVHLVSVYASIFIVQRIKLISLRYFTQESPMDSPLAPIWASPK
jgi:hypothetical protein